MILTQQHDHNKPTTIFILLNSNCDKSDFCCAIVVFVII